MDYVGTVIRPPGEAESLVLQYTVGCTHNRCSFCPAYKHVRFRMKPADIVVRDIADARHRWPGTRRVFVADGDALVVRTDRLLALFSQLRAAFPQLVRIGIYGNTRAILRKSVDELRTLRDAGLGIVYWGIESGNDDVLRHVRKGTTADDAVRAAGRLHAAGIKASVTVLLGIGGMARSVDHARDTGRLLSLIQPEQASALTVMVVPGTPLHDEMEDGAFVLPDAFGMLAELREMLACTEMRRGLFLANHASNYLPLKLRMPRDRDGAIALLDDVLERRDRRVLVPEHFRGL